MALFAGPVGYGLCMAGRAQEYRDDDGYHGQPGADGEYVADRSAESRIESVEKAVRHPAAVAVIARQCGNQGVGCLRIHQRPGVVLEGVETARAARRP